MEATTGGIAPAKIYIKGISQLEYNQALNSTNAYTHAMLGVFSEEESAQR
jgi:hypothetical protein